MTPEQVRWLTWGAIQHRPAGAPKWDEPGTHKAIADHCGSWGLDIATQHVLAHARDPKARTPFAIKGNPPHTEPERGSRYPAKPGQDCRAHPGEWADTCRSCAADRLAGDRPDATTQRPARPADPATRQQAIAAARAAINRAGDGRGVAETTPSEATGCPRSALQAPNGPRPHPDHERPPTGRTAKEDA